ncbi:conserved hypothetical protein (plasmid) [Methylorubrum extorquens AM1]|uniref:Uncharacterized protein n=1 Tax=Methylorubrum extorquens (strain ATCC 14718 / DSM 1338 / JCM 2805 / NCIMB 9133 / AM1) TaxID=272630 RepID=C5B586_METEA|nr:conserved hypothetical protein [Methylorubrum extorquens AM1]
MSRPSTDVIVAVGPRQVAAYSRLHAEPIAALPVSAPRSTIGAILMALVFLWRCQGGA